MIRAHIKYLLWLLAWLPPQAARAQAWTFNHFAGAAVSGAGAYDGTGIDAKLNHPLGAAVDSADTVYVADTYNHTIRKITATGVLTTLAGLALTSGSTDGAGPAARVTNRTEKRRRGTEGRLRWRP